MRKVAFEAIAPLLQRRVLVLIVFISIVWLWIMKISIGRWIGVPIVPAYLSIILPAFLVPSPPKNTSLGTRALGALAVGMLLLAGLGQTYFSYIGGRLSPNNVIPDVMLWTQVTALLLGVLYAQRVLIHDATEKPPRDEEEHAGLALEVVRETDRPVVEAILRRAHRAERAAASTLLGIAAVACSAIVTVWSVTDIDQLSALSDVDAFRGKMTNMQSMLAEAVRELPDSLDRRRLDLKQARFDSGSWDRRPDS